MKDYLIVGCGLAGIAFSETALQHGKSIMVVDAGKKASSLVAGGLYNPVVLKRFTPIWKAIEVSKGLSAFYNELESKLNIRVDYPYPVLRRFFSVEEQNNWFAASDKPVLSELLLPAIKDYAFNGLSSPFGYGEVLQTGYVDTALLLIKYQDWLKRNDLLIVETFDYNAVRVSNGCVQYKGIQARHLICCDGFAMHQNPFFSYLPLDGTKGELLVIKADELNLHDYIVNAGVFILPLGDGLFKVGATYDPIDKTMSTTAKGRSELIDKLSEIITCHYEVIEQFVGIRPTVKDRRGLIGAHPEYKNIFILNGLGSRGVVLAPYLANELYNAIEDNITIDAEVDIKRYQKKFYRRAGPS